MEKAFKRIKEEEVGGSDWVASAPLRTDEARSFPLLWSHWHNGGFGKFWQQAAAGSPLAGTAGLVGNLGNVGRHRDTRREGTTDY